MNNNLSNIVGLPLAPCLEREESQAILDHKIINDFEGEFHYLPYTVMYSVTARSVVAMLLVDLPLGSSRKIEATVPITLFTDVDYDDSLPSLLYFGEDRKAIKVTVMIWGDKLRYNDGIERPMNLVKHLKTVA